MMRDEPMHGITIFSHANKMTQAYHVMLAPLCREAGMPPLAMDILLFLANNPEHDTAKDICRLRGHKSGIVSVHVERLVNDGLLEHLATMRRCLERMDGNLNGICKEKR